MPTKRPPASAPPSPKWAGINSYLRGGREPVDPVRAEWDTGEYEGTCYTLRNFRLGRYEWAYGKIPTERLPDYTDSGTGSNSARS